MSKSLVVPRLLPHIATLAAGSLLLFSVVGSQAVLFPPPPAEKGETACGAGGCNAGQPTKTVGDVTEISRWRLFGEAETPKATLSSKPAVARIEAPQTSLKLILIGVFTPSSGGASGWAIIETPQKEHKTFTVGDELPGGATLYAVEESRVILSRAGKYESLKLNKPEFSAEGEADIADVEKLTIKENSRVSSYASSAENRRRWGGRRENGRGNMPPAAPPVPPAPAGELRLNDPMAALVQKVERAQSGGAEDLAKAIEQLQQGGDGDSEGMGRLMADLEAAGINKISSPDAAELSEIMNRASNNPDLAEFLAKLRAAGQASGTQAP